MRTKIDLVILCSLVLFSHDAARAGQELATDATVGKLETVALFPGPMPTGVTVSSRGRIFVNFPRWGDPVEFTVGEVRGGKAVAYPDPQINRLPRGNQAAGLVSVQSVVVDPRDRLWILDTGSIQFGPTSPGGPKLVGVDLATDRVFKTITFPPDVALPTSYLNDVRFDLRRGRAGTAYITDSSVKGTNAILVVDLATGRSQRRLANHPSTRPEPAFLGIVEGQPLMNRPPRGAPTHQSVGADGIAISSDGAYLYYSPLSARRLYRVPTALLADPGVDESRLAASVEDLGFKPASDGLESDAEGRIYATAYEHDAVLRRDASGAWSTIAHDPRLLWPDTLSLAPDGWLYVTANQLHRQASFHEGHDLRQKPYALMRLRVDARPVALR